MIKKVLQLTVHFSPNVGGVETHLDDLIRSLVERNWQVFVLTYRPLTTEAKWKVYQKDQGIEILRLPWLPGLFYRLIKHPALEFFYLLPGLFLVTPLVMMIKNPDVVHVHGLVAACTGVFWGKLFNKKVVISTHSIYNFPSKGLYYGLVKWLFQNARRVLGLSKQAQREIASLGIAREKIDHFTYWVDLDRFKKVKDAKEILGWKDKFTILFVGRLIEEKGLVELLQAAKMWDKNITLMIAGKGPLEDKVREASTNYSNIEFTGIITQDKLPMIYSASDILIVPSTSEEGFGRVILEALACGTPIIGANRGAIPEAMDETVGRLIEVTPDNVKEAVEYFFNNRGELKELAQNCRKFAERRYSERNVETIIRSYTD